MENEKVSNWYDDAKLDIKALRNSSKIIFIIIILVSIFIIFRLGNSNLGEPIFLFYWFLMILGSILMWSFFNVICVIASTLIEIKKDLKRD